MSAGRIIADHQVSRVFFVLYYCSLFKGLKTMTGQSSVNETKVFENYRRVRWQMAKTILKQIMCSDVFKSHFHVFAPLIRQ